MMTRDGRQSAGVEVRSGRECRDRPPRRLIWWSGKATATGRFQLISHAHAHAMATCDEHHGPSWLLSARSSSRPCPRYRLLGSEQLNSIHGASETTTCNTIIGARDASRSSAQRPDVPRHACSEERNRSGWVYRIARTIFSSPTQHQRDGELRAAQSDSRTLSSSPPVLCSALSSHCRSSAEQTSGTPSRRPIRGVKAVLIL